MKLILCYFLVSLLVFGCAKLEKEYPQRTFYIFNVMPESNPSRSITDNILGIRRFRISPAYQGNQFVYRISRDGYESDFYNQFFKSPASLLTEVVSTWLSKSSPFKFVVEANTDVRPDFVLDGFVNAIYGDYSDKGPPKAVLRVQFFLIREVSAENEIVFNRTYGKEINMSSQSPNALIEGWNEALKQILREFEKDLVQINLSVPSKPINDSLS